MNQEEKQYLNLLQQILNTGSTKNDRTGVGTIGVFGSQLRFSLKDNTLPLLTTKKMFLRGIVEELLFFIRGDTDTKKLEEKGVNIWKGNTSREFLDKRNLKYLPEGSIGKGYGFQWRNFGGTEQPFNYKSYFKDGVDQLKNALELIKNEPTSRKIIVSAWNPEQLKEMALEPCHMMFQFHVENGKLNLQWYQRSVDTFLGLPFNIASYAILNMLFAKATNLEPGDLIFCGGDTHCYLNHINQVKEQITREPYNFPKLSINKNISSIEDMENLSFEDFKLLDYTSHSSIKAQMAI
jgi:thymidylate synthase